MKLSTKIMLGVNVFLAASAIAKAVLVNKGVKNAEVIEIGAYEVKVDRAGIIKANHAAVAMVAKMTNGSYQIFVDEMFLGLKKDVQVAILAHETGHIKLGHLENLSKLNMYKRAIDSLTGAQNIELEADAYGASIVGANNMIKALKALKGLKININKREIDFRIKTLQQGGL